VLLLVFLLLFGIGFNSTLLFFPFAFFGVILFGTTVGLFLTPIGMLYNDIAKMISMGLSLVMYITPVVYAIPKDGFMKTIMEINPLTPLILTARDLAVGLTPQYISYYVIILAICIPLLLLGLLFYRISIPILVERMSA
jgi:lipopolysaccharide transport system permease protein